MSGKSWIEILDEIRNSRNEDLIRERDNRVFFTVAMKLERGSNSGKKIYRIIEEYSIGDNKSQEDFSNGEIRSQIRELFYEYKTNPELIAMRDLEKNNGSTDILPVGNYYTEESEEWNDVLKDIVEGVDYRREKVREKARNIGIENASVDDIDREIDLYKMIEDKIKDDNNKGISKEKNMNTKDAQTISVERAQRSGIIGMNSISLDQRVGLHGETLRKELGLDSKEYNNIDYIEIVPTYKVAKAGGIVYRDTPFVPVGRNSRTGGLVIFPENICSPYRAENTVVTGVEGKHDNIKQKRTNCLISFNGKSLMIGQKEYGIVDVSLSYPTKDNAGNIAYNLQSKVEDGTHEQDRESLEVINTYQGIYNSKDRLTEFNFNSESDKKNAKMIDMNGNYRDMTHLDKDEFGRLLEKVPEIKEMIEEIVKENKLNNVQEVLDSVLVEIQEEIARDRDISDSDIERIKGDICDRIREQYHGKTDKRG